MRSFRIFLLFMFFICNSVLAKDLSVTIDFGDKAATEDWYQMVLWLEDSKGNYLETLYVTAETGKEGLGNKYKTLFGVTVREEPGDLPVWAHARNILLDKSLYPSKAKPLSDAVTGATPKQKHLVKTFNLAQNIFDKARYVFLEINVTQDGIPSIVYRAPIPVGKQKTTTFRLVGTGQIDGKDGKLYPLPQKVVANDFIQSASVSD